MKCGRCDKELGAANTHNAYYIRNVNDKRTFGDNEVTEFSLTKVDGTIETSYDFKDLKIKEAENIKADIEEKQKIRITARTVIRKVPKTLIICKNCKQKKDEIIW